MRAVPPAGSPGQEPGQRSRAGAPAPLTTAARAAAITPRATTRALFPRKSTRPRVTRSQPAFEIVKAAHERLEDEERMAFCQRICGAAQDAVEKRVRSAKKKLAKAGEDDVVPEDDPARMELAIKVMISRMFAEFEQRKAQLEERDVANRKKAKEEQARAPPTCKLYGRHVAAAATWQRPSRAHQAAIALACTHAYLRPACHVQSNPGPLPRVRRSASLWRRWPSASRRCGRSRGRSASTAGARGTRAAAASTPRCQRCGSCYHRCVRAMRLARGVLTDYSQTMPTPTPHQVKEERRPDGSGYNSHWDGKGEEYKKEWR